MQKTDKKDKGAELAELAEKLKALAPYFPVHARYQWAIDNHKHAITADRYMKGVVKDVLLGRELLRYVEAYVKKNKISEV
jgi:hypothetical protein